VIVYTIFKWRVDFSLFLLMWHIGSGNLNLLYLLFIYLLVRILKFIVLGGFSLGRIESGGNASFLTFVEANASTFQVYARRQLNASVSLPFSFTFHENQ